MTTFVPSTWSIEDMQAFVDLQQAVAILSAYLRKRHSYLRANVDAIYWKVWTWCVGLFVVDRSRAVML
ncbi:hypothetical protein GUJ93_ZPchr0010g9077 [Zizania palustris]|uniref:Uncharacterized protein n=1 Tax=Zizania palustris TaxID=103762 RepID=A0A8J5TBH4_ZIZPA|nr:hypothetical protein GUJ93_ZPchr0010g9077 [Zizania palustris]